MMLEGNKTLFRKAGFEFSLRHLLVFGVLVLAFTTAFIMRSYPAKYGFYLNEFDPYFDYRATKYIVDHGLDAYWKWHDTMSWYPEGRDIAKTSQSGLHIVAAFLYTVFGKGTSLLNFTIILPVVMGSLTTIIVFALVRVIGGTSAGLFAALLFAFSPPIIQRGNLGWFKSEPLGLFFGLFAAYLFLSAIKHKEIKYALPKAAIGGLLLGLANASWGGIQYFSIPISLFLIVLPFFKKDTRIATFVAITFTVFALISAGSFPRPGISFVIGLPGIALIGGTIFLIIANFLKRIRPRVQIRNMLFLLFAFIAVAMGVLLAGAYHPSYFRYINAINPFLSSKNALTESVAEHFTPTLVDYFSDYSILLMFAGLGAWMAFKRRNDMSIFALIIGITGAYVSATFARLLVFASIGIIVLAALGIYEVTRSILENKESTSLSAGAETRTAKLKKTKRKKFGQAGGAIQPEKVRNLRIAYVVAIIFMLLIPLVYPPSSNWLISADIPPSIANGGTGYKIQTNDWIDALNWISRNTPKNAVIASWWDYGYWITTLGNRTSLADNGTINQTRIQTIAKMFIDKPEDGIKVARQLKTDYILLYIVAQRLAGANGTSFYTLGSGGDESKKQWFMRIGGFDENKYLEQDGLTPTPLFWNTTLLGKMMPFNVEAYASRANIQPQYSPGTIALYSKHIKYPVNSTQPSQPLSLVYASPTFNNKDPGIVFGVLIYKVNHNYIPTKSK